MTRRWTRTSRCSRRWRRICWPSTRGRKYHAFRRARTAIWLALGARHLALAAAGPRQSHTYHQYASELPQPAATTRTAPDYARYFRPRVLGADERRAERGAHDVQLVA